MSFQHIEDAARAALADCGLAPPKHFAYGKFLVVGAIDGKPGDNAGRVKVFTDGLGGFVQNWRTGEKRSFFLNAAGADSQLSEAERQRIDRERKRRQAEEMARMDRAAKRALSIWQAAAPAPAEHPYLIAKHIQPHCARVATWRRVIDNEGAKQTVSIENALLVPMFDAAGTVRSLQAIFPTKHPLFGNRNKDFLPGGGLAGLFGFIGQRTDKVLIAEGFATGATLHEETGLRVYLAFTANNLLAVGRIVRDKLPNAEIVFAADNDTETAGNPGLTKATEAAAAVGGSVTVPPIPDSDFNDYAAYRRQGGDHVE
ncbi:toprim domain-containing protein [Methylomonas sp. UP202]|uniref:toprim domain-containing protein n=1 Tax=Methylomonas sp. UP202 TaxID=3040943 RepID=UPI00247AA514|nr:toprim domain-containing protein [Methylomonas sp. UP202]WGS84322.1 toprim domain-containing protein [Methylomonas sp. UP202]